MGRWGDPLRGWVPPAGPHFSHEKWGKECQGKEFLSPGPLSLVCEILFYESAGLPVRATGWRAGTSGENLRCRVPSWWARPDPHWTTGRRPGHSPMIPGSIPTASPRVQGGALVLFLPAFSRESRALPEALNHVAGFPQRKKETVTKHRFFLKFNHTCNSRWAERILRCRPRGRGQSCGGALP